MDHPRWAARVAAMTAAPTHAGIGRALREWRNRRRMSQLDLAGDAGISTRHLSFVETGRSHPGREPLLRIMRELDVPYREQNRLLLAAGHAPAFPEAPLEGAELAPVRDALDRILEGHEPNPGVAIDRHWNLVKANRTMELLTARYSEIAPDLLEPPVNILRAGLHPRGMAPVLSNLGRWKAHFLERLERQVAVSGDAELAQLLEEVSGYPVPEDDAAEPAGNGPLGVLKVTTPGGGPELSFFGMFAIFDTPFEITTSELALELMFPANARTAELLQALASGASPSDRGRDGR
jgi:transcriptional regulator with XRE-family HTH domain